MVTLKLARTADGFAAGDEHDPRLAITGEAANLRVQVMRSLHDAIMVGVGTARDDDPLLTVRLPGVDSRPLRVVLDSRLDLPLRSRLCATAREFPTLVDRDARGGRGARSGAGRQRASKWRGSTPIPRAASISARRCGCSARRGVTRVFSEGGPRVGARLIALGLADEVVLLTALKPLGRPGLPALDARALAVLTIPRATAKSKPPTTAPTLLRRWERLS